MTQTIDAGDVAAVVQGPCGPTTPETIESIRRQLPGVRIVLSTWDGSDTSGLDVDEVVLSADPGTFSCVTFRGVAGPPINTNRMLVSTSAGLRRAQRPYTIKLRTDAVVEHPGVMWLLAELPPTIGEWQLFERTVGVSSVYTRNPLKTPTGSYHPADTIQFGRTADLLTLWDVPLMPEADAMFWPDSESRPVWSVTSQRYYPEQWIFVSALRTRYRVDFDHRADFSDTTIAASNRALAQNFFVAEPWELGIRVPHLDRQLRWGEDPLCVMTHPIWQQLRDEAELRLAERPGA